MSEIFAKARLAPTQVRSVANRRYDDAVALQQTGKNARANGAMYMGGYAVECLLKARLLEKCKWLQQASSPEGKGAEEKIVWEMCYRRHDLDRLKDYLELEKEIRSNEKNSQTASKLVQSLKSVCSQWTVHARYSPQQASISEAKRFLDEVKELMRWLR